MLADPEGNEFCIIEPENNFLAGCGRLGSITCDGTQEVGYFWSAALGWPLVWDQDEETAIRAPDGSGPSSRGAVRRSPRRSARTGCISTSLRPTTVNSVRRSTVSLRLRRPASTSAKTLSIG